LGVAYALKIFEFMRDKYESIISLNEFGFVSRRNTITSKRIIDSNSNKE
jgi:hypothetical protein